MTDNFDLNAYLARIGWHSQSEGKETAADEVRHDLPTLSALLRAHMSTIPFENIDVLLNRTVHMDIESVQDKLVRAGRGGYCFEHGALFTAALTRLGFQPTPHLARVTMTTPRAEAPQTHMFLTVPIGDERYVLDPGFGGLAARVPVPLREGTTAQVDGDTYSMVRDGSLWICRLADRKRLVDLWVSHVDEVIPIDFVVANHYTASHPNSPFKQRLMMRTNSPSGRVSVMNRHVTFHDEQPPRNAHLADRADLRKLLIERFGFDLPEVEQIKVPLVPEWR